MAAQALIEQHIIFIKNTDNNIEENAILSNSLIQSLAANSQGNDIIMEYHNYMHWTGTAWQSNVLLELRCYVAVAFQATIQTNIPNLQAAFPNYTVVTWGNATTFGN